MSWIEVLVVEDEPIAREILVENLTGAGYQVATATSGSDAWELVSGAPERYDVLLLDRMMPDMDGIEILHRVKADPALRDKPVIMQTALTGNSEISEGLQAGAYYYLTKPFGAETLLAIVGAAVRDRITYAELKQELQNAIRPLTLLRTAEFVFRTPAEARDIATLIANAAPAPDRVVMGLSELMHNAIEHGNLGITYHDKTRLLETKNWDAEVARRLALPENADKRALITVERTDRELLFLIRDQGPGFEWHEFLHITPSRAGHTHGRGIALARMLSFDGLEYLGNGNQVRATVNL